MSKKEFNPYRDMLGISSLKDEDPTDYQLLGIDDFEGDPQKIAAAYEKRSQRIAELYQTVTEMSRKIDGARDRISDSAKKEEYDNYLRKTGRAGVTHLGKLGAASVLSSFVLSILTVIVSTFCIYPMVVTIPPENYGDSVTTLPDYKETQAQKELEVLKVQQEDVLTMDVNVNAPVDVDVDVDSSVEFLEVPVTDIPGEETKVDDLPSPDALAPVEEPSAPAQDELVEPDPPAVEQPKVDKPAEPEPSAVEQPAADEPAAPEPPAVEQPAVDEPAAPETPDVEEATVEEPLEQDETTIEKPSEDAPEIIVDPLAPEEPALPDNSPSDNLSGPVSPVVPKVLNMDDSEIPELPPLGELETSASPTAPTPPVIPELSAATEAPLAPVPPAIPELASVPEAPSVASSAPIAKKPVIIEPPTVEPSDVTVVTQANPPLSSGVVLEDVDMLEQFVQLGQKARSNADFAQLISSARQAEADLIKKKEFYKAQQIADVVYESCARSADKTCRAEAYRYKEFFSKRSAWWESVRLAQKKMEANETVSSAEANLGARWCIEIENDWENGLKFLALSDNEQVRNAAQNEISVNQEDVRSVLIVANNWWNLAQDPIPMQKQFREHASKWYAKALPSIADKQIRTLIEKRIAIAEQGFSKH